ncbi:MAG: peptide chain release factor 2 [Gemmatimonadetes bacterium]|nr:MAG: peptide chain release factor 2 [Gemmatimonadota bacterium]
MALSDRFQDFQRRLTELRGFLEVDGKVKRLGELEHVMAEGNIWSDPAQASQVVQEVKELKRWVEPYEAVRKRIDDARALYELSQDESDEGHAHLVAEVLKGRSLEDEADRIAADLEALELQNMLQGPDDSRAALLTIHPGAGGTESQDWAEMLMRMYVRWAERHGFKVEVLDLLEGEEAGIKSAEIQISGRYAYGLLKAEKGVHRLVRISPFDAQSRRHTSFASVFVYPVVDEDIEIEIRDEDLRVDTFRASGKGGQHVNKTSSAVRITHLPTGIVVSCQQERSQHKNKATALKMLKARLYERAVEEREAKKAEVDKQKMDIAFGNQIRSYVFQPYTMVNDHRTDLKVSDVHKVMDGDLDPFIEAFLKRFGSKAA